MMKKIVILLLFIGTMFPVLSQNNSDSLKLYTELYNKALTFYFNDSIYLKQDVDDFILITSAIDSTALIKRVNSNSLCFIPNYAIEQVLRRPYKKSKGRIYFRINHKAVADNVIDINIYQSVVNYKNGRWNFGISCGGTMGYIPDFRFIYDMNNDVWICLTAAQIMKWMREQEKKDWRKFQDFEIDDLVFDINDNK